MKFLIYCLLAMLWPAGNSIAQTQATTIRPLTVGDTLPDVEIANIINSPVSKIQLSSYKGKLLILDFWATWCNSCISTFPKLDTLQTKFNNRLQFVLINTLTRSLNTKENVAGFFKQRKGLAHNLRHIPVCTDTTIRLTQLFPCKFIPHYVWVSPAGIIIAITGSEAVTTSNIRKAIRGKPLRLPIKKE